MSKDKFEPNYNTKMKMKSVQKVKSADYLYNFIVLEILYISIYFLNSNILIYACIYQVLMRILSFNNS